MSAKAIAQDLAATGQVDYWTFVWGAHANSLHRHLPTAHGPRHPYLADIKDLRQAAPEIPAGAIGYLTDPNEAEHALTDGTADIVFLGRPLITDAAWGNKAQAGREADIRYCVSCNTCWRTIIEGTRLECDNNPRVAEPDELDPISVPPGKGKRVVVVGWRNRRYGSGVDCRCTRPRGDAIFKSLTNRAVRREFMRSSRAERISAVFTIISCWPATSMASTIAGGRQQLPRTSWS